MNPKPVSYKDRTHEFSSIAGKLKPPSSLPSTSGASSTTGFDGGGSVSTPQPSRSVAPIKSEFNKKAAKMGLGIHQISQKLSRLSQLAKRTSVFDDPAREIQELTAIIKQDISALNSAIVDLQLMCSSQNEGNLSSDGSAHSSTVVDNLKNDLMNATKEFKEVLTMRTENMKVHEDRRQLFSSASKESSNAFIRQRPLATRTAATAAISLPPWASDSGTSSQSFSRFDVAAVRAGARTS